ncbi:MAG TPA: hypothetical protein VJ063_06295 [Verrucomicrobiae bacterium]|nr:hypothetical protein [Verrucomicrobiae bacterium]
MSASLIYLICFGVGLLFTIVSALLGDVSGHDADHGDHVGTGGHAAAGFDHSGMPGVSPFSPTVIASFVTAFGGFGLILTRIPATQAPWLHAPLAVVGAFGIAGGVFYLFNKVFSSTQSSSESRVATVVGLQATVITPIPQHGVGEIAYVQAGCRYTAPARTETGAAVTAGATVKITRVAGGTQYYVAPV